MLSDWYIRIQAEEVDLGFMRHVVDGSAEHTLTEEDGEYRLRSTRFRGVTDYQDAFPIANTLVQSILDAAGFVARARISCRRGPLGRGPTAGPTDQFISVPTLVYERRPAPPDPAAQDESGKARIQKVLRLQQANPNVEVAIHLLNLEPNWLNLSNAYERVVADMGREAALIARGWISRRTARRFRAAANIRSASGDAARHSDPTKPAPKNPMSLDDARALIRGLVQRWIEELA